MKIRNQKELQLIIFGIEFKDFMKACKGYTKEPFSFLVNDATLPSDNPLRFRKKLL